MHVYVSWISLAVAIPWDILPALPPQGHSWAASRTNIPIIDKAGSSQRQVLTFSLLLQLLQCLFRGFQAADAIPCASLSVHSSLCSLNSHHCHLLVKWENSQWHLCNSRAGMEMWQVCGAPWVHGRAWVVTPKPTSRWTKGWVAKLMAEGSSQGTRSSSPLSCWRHPASPTHPTTEELEYHGHITCTHRTAAGSVSRTLAMNVPSCLLLSQTTISQWKKRENKNGVEENQPFFMDHGILRISSPVITAPANRYQVNHSLVIFCSAIFFSKIFPSPGIVSELNGQNTW